jgi:hypothetical protein
MHHGWFNSEKGREHLRFVVLSRRGRPLDPLPLMRPATQRVKPCQRTSVRHSGIGFG